MSKASEPELVFLVCQPRSGSTMLQRMLGEHSVVHTTSEPWLMLPPMYALRGEGMQAEYHAGLAHTGLMSFLSELPEGENEYLKGVRQMYGFLYGRALAGTGADIFLDKTPRYYLILPELCRVFPKAKFIVLLRHPIAVLASVLKTWVEPNWLELTHYQQDLFDAPDLLLEGTDTLGERVLEVHYEKIVQQPNEELRRLCDFIGISFEKSMVDYGGGRSEDWELGDPSSVYDRDQPTRDSLTKWKQRTEDSQYLRLFREYARCLGPDLFQRLGYEYPDILEEKSLTFLDNVSTCSLSWLMQESRPFPTRVHWHTARIGHEARKRGVKGVVQYLTERSAAHLRDSS